MFVKEAGDRIISCFAWLGACATRSAGGIINAVAAAVLPTDYDGSHRVLTNAAGGADTAGVAALAAPCPPLIVSCTHPDLANALVGTVNQPGAMIGIATDLGDGCVRVVVANDTLVSKADNAGVVKPRSPAECIALAALVLQELQLEAGSLSTREPLRYFIEKGEAQLFPLHGKAAIQSLREQWGVLQVPVHAITHYLGPAPGMYLAFLHTITSTLLPVAALSCILWIASVAMGFGRHAGGPGTHPAALPSCLALLAALWIFASLALWKRREASLAKQWRVGAQVGLHPLPRLGIDELQGSESEPAASVSGSERHRDAASRAGSRGRRSRRAVPRLRIGTTGVPIIMIAAILASLACFFTLERFRMALQTDLAEPVPQPVTVFEQALLTQDDMMLHGDTTEAVEMAVASMLAASYAEFAAGRIAAQSEIKRCAWTSDLLHCAADAASRSLDRAIRHVVDNLVVAPLRSRDTGRKLLTQAVTAHAETESKSAAVTIIVTMADLMPARWRVPLQGLPWLALTIGIVLQSWLAGKLARWLTAREHHDHHDASLSPASGAWYDRDAAAAAATIKRLVLTGLPCFCSIAFVCFWQQDMEQVQLHVLSLLVVSLGALLPSRCRAPDSVSEGLSSVLTRHFTTIARRVTMCLRGLGFLPTQLHALLSVPEGLSAIAALLPVSAAPHTDASAQQEAMVPAAGAAGAAGAAEDVIIPQRQAAQAEACLPVYHPLAREGAASVLLLLIAMAFAAAFPLAPALVTAIWAAHMWVQKRDVLTQRRPVPAVGHHHDASGELRSGSSVFTFFDAPFNALSSIALATNVAVAYVISTQSAIGNAKAADDITYSSSTAGSLSSTVTTTPHAPARFVLLLVAIACSKWLVDQLMVKTKSITAAVQAARGEVLRLAA